MNTQALTVHVDVDADTIKAQIRDSSTEAVALISPLSEAQRETLVANAWTFGMRALTHAYKQAAEARLQDIGKELVTDMETQLDQYVERQERAMVAMLQRYFDPKDGHVATRIEAFVRDGGEISRAMEKYLAPESGSLAKVLARELGENSPLLRRLSPTNSEGIVAIIEQRIREALEKNKVSMETALDPLAPNGAVARFMQTLRSDLEKADQNRTKQLALATKALDANDETSLLSRLVRETKTAREALLHAMNPAEPGSPLAHLTNSLTELLQKHAESQDARMATFEEQQRKLDLDLRDTVARLEAKKKADNTSSRGGVSFEQAVLGFVRRAVQGAPVTVDDTGATVGARPSCKVGDQVLRFTAESVFAGAGLVIEAKHDASKTVTDALKELEVARSNRQCQVGLFVMARSHAPAGFPDLARHGADVLVIWDHEDEASDAYLHAGVILALALATRHAKGDAADGDLEALADIEHCIQHELARHERMRKSVEAIQKHAEQLTEELRKSDKKMSGLLSKAKDTLKALNVELKDHALEASEPIGLLEGSLESAQNAAAE